MAQDLVFYTNPMSRGRIVRWMLEELGVPYRTEIIGYGPAMKAPAFTALNPMGKVPMIRHGKVVVTESAAICAYLADAFPEAGLAPPPGDPARGAYYRWLFFGAGPVEAAVADAAMGVAPGEEQRALVGYGCMADVMNMLEYAVQDGGFLAGDRFSAADLYLGSQIGWGMHFGTLEKRPALERYWSKLSGRPAARRALAMDEALMPEKRD
ncbi:glutathione S-transferase family protein [Teichococcus oryzae]|uniref:Glutathione S-transferase family protein n=1 Tax=Teichococcus oryzae TaxID=1608942 RepID=A0A5B2TG92_9PROT|nr:glutathione S-transferase family protein [Pseudoroseomonas oryzae]KAA2213134.1 glutathione S-transferase family protein [Pseudoroseomonas oryzae]